MQEQYVVCDIEDIKRNQNQRVAECVELFSVTEEEAVILLREYKWNNDRLQGDWFENQNKIRYKCGLAMDPEYRKSKPQMETSLAEKNQGMCAICYTPFDGAKDQLSCGHQFCCDCWSYYLQQKVSEGYQQCIMTTCP